MPNITVRIDNEIRDWLNKQPRSLNISNLIREFLHSIMEKQDDLNDSTDIKEIWLRQRGN